MRNNREFQKASKKGMTLIALVITIVILIILATVTLSYLFGENGLIGYAYKSKEIAEVDSKEEGKELTNMEEYLNRYVEEQAKEPEQIPISIADAKNKDYVFTSKTPIKDEKNNTVMIPEGFKIAKDSGDTVQQGIVIEDISASNDVNVQGSQYVWIPVGIFTKDDGSTSAEIELGRYIFDRFTGTPTLKQNKENYKDQSKDILVDSYFKEVVEYRQGITSSGNEGLNATAKDLEEFINSVEENGGYYIGRYEASYASGNSTENYKAASKISNAHSEDSMLYIPGALWNYITQIDASKVAINTYAESSSIKSDLINSYAWDTAIVYIQEAGNNNYANQISKNTSLADTGKNGDEVCKINDMASNIREWTTEYSSYTYDDGANPCTGRGGYYNVSNDYTAFRISNDATFNKYHIGFRLNLYLDV